MHGNTSVPSSKMLIRRILALALLATQNRFADIPSTRIFTLPQTEEHTAPLMKPSPRVPDILAVCEYFGNH